MRAISFFPPVAIVRLLGFACMVLLGSGCAVYQYDVVLPAPLAGRVEGDVDKVLDVNPLTYRLRSVDNRLVVRIYNPTQDPIEIVGPRSAVVDPYGQSHPLRGQTIAPGAYVKLILPPPRPTYYESGPDVGFGLGVGFGGYHHHRAFYGGGVFYDGPRSYTIYDENDVVFWDWNGETDARLILTYQRGERSFHDEFTFHRVRKS